MDGVDTQTLRLTVVGRMKHLEPYYRSRKGGVCGCFPNQLLVLILIAWFRVVFGRPLEAANVGNRLPTKRETLPVVLFEKCGREQ